jgi:hypothetical protein
MQSLKQYVQEHAIEPLQLALVARVRYLTIYNAINGKPISYTCAQKIRVALHVLTGVAYAGLLPVIDDPIEEQQTRPLSKIILLR